MKNASDLRTEMVSVFKQLKSRKIDTITAKSFVAISNSIIKSAAAEAEYNKFLGKKDPISFLQTQK